MHVHARAQKQKFRMRKQAKQRKRIEKTQIKVKQRRQQRLGLLYERWNEALAFTWTSSTVNALFSQLIPKVSRSICSTSISLLSKLLLGRPQPSVPLPRPPSVLSRSIKWTMEELSCCPFGFPSARSFIERRAATSSQPLEVCLRGGAEDKRTCRLTGLFWKEHDKVSD